MPIKYYPTSRVQINLTTTGNLFMLNGVPYAGPYYLTYDGRAFTGPNPAAGGNELLEPMQPPTQVATSRLSRRRDNQVAKTISTTYTREGVTSIVQLKQIVPYYPQPVEDDYKRGYFTRYFAKKVNVNGYITEISYETYGLIFNREDNTYEDYEVEDMFWQLTGPKNDKRVSQYQIVGGVYDTNKRVTESKERGFRGIIQFIGGDYTKYARLTD